MGDILVNELGVSVLRPDDAKSKKAATFFM